MLTRISVRFVLFKSAIICLFALFLLLPPACIVRAQSFQVDVAFTPDMMTAMPGDAVNYTAVFTNNTNTDLFIADAGLNSTDANFFTTDNNFGFFNGMGGSGFELMAMQTLTVNDVITLFLDPNTPAGSFPIDATFSGRNFSDVGNSSVRNADVGTGTLNITITPEPGSIALVASLVVAGAVFVRKRRVCV